MSKDDRDALMVIAVVLGAVGLMFFVMYYPQAIADFFTKVFRAFSP